MPQDTLPLTGVTILVFEDEPLIAMDIVTTLEDAGAEVIGPCGTVASALSLIERYDRPSPLNGAVLDVDLGRETSIPIAHAHPGHAKITGGPCLRDALGCKPSDRYLVDALLPPLVDAPALRGLDPGAEADELQLHVGTVTGTCRLRL